MIDLLAWLFTIAGITYGITTAGITTVLRVSVYRISPFIGTSFYCPACIGFWVGVWTSLLVDWSPLYATHPLFAGRIILSGIAAMTVGMLLQPYMSTQAVWLNEEELRTENDSTL